MRISLFVLAVVVSIGLFSCQKEISEADPSGPTGGGDRLLTKYVYNENEQTWTDTFLFDAQNRVLRVNEAYTDTRSQNPDPYLWFWEMHYNGNETLPFKVTDTSQGRDMNWYILYDGLKRKTVDSFTYLSSGDRFVTYYNYQGNTVVAKTFSTYGGNPTALTSIDTLVTDGSNWVRLSFVNPIAPNNNYFETISYDNRPTPFSTLNITPAVYYGANYVIGDISQSGKNNGTTFNFFGGQFGAVFKYQYVYDAEGYPVSSTFFEESDPTINGGEKFVYKQ